jgi:predicted RNA-binding protein with PUA-like domain
VRNNPACENMLLIRKGQRLSVQPVNESDFDIILAMGGISRHQL